MIRAWQLGIIYFIIAIFVIILGFAVYKKNKQAALNRIALVICFLIGEWVLCNAIKGFCTAQAPIIFFHEAKYIGIILVPVFLFIMSLQYTQIKVPILSKQPLILFIIPFITMAMVISNPLHHLFRKSIEVMLTANGAMLIHSQNGFWYWIHAYYSFALIISTMIVFFIDLIRQPQIYKVRPAIIVFGIGFPAFINMLFDSSLVDLKLPIEITPLCFIVSMLFIYYAIYLYKPWLIVPLARKLIIDNMDNPVILIDNQGLIMDINFAASQMLTADGQNLVGKSVNILSQTWHSILTNSLDDNQEILAITEENQEKFYKYSQVILKDKKKKPIGSLTVFTDITELKVAMDRMEFLGLYDQVTGIKNRMYFETELSRLDNELYYPLGIVMGDVNGLKLVNDAFGHQMGDVLLRKAAETIRDACAADYTVARIGGDEFGIIIPRCEEKSILALIDKIKNNCEEITELTSPLSISFGFAIKNKSGESLTDTIKKADELMYKHKMLESRSVRSAMIGTLKKALAAKNIETEEHQERTKILAIELGKAMELPAPMLDDLELLALLHDSGKLGIPDQILMNPNPLNSEEWEVVRKHPEKGYHIASAIPELSSISEAILSHHEYWDGNGYPCGKSGEDIPLLARIIAVVEAYDMMTHDSTYQKCVSEEKALAEIALCSGSQFDPFIADQFIRLKKGR